MSFLFCNVKQQILFEMTKDVNFVGGLLSRARELIFDKKLIYNMCMVEIVVICT